MMRLIVFILFVVLAVNLQAQQKMNGFDIVNRKEKQEIAVYWKGNLLTAYCYYDSIRKPILFPIRTMDGITVTRGYPIQPVPGERTDHPHHAGLWMNYESVNGLDFWNNSTAIPVANRHRYGTIRHEQVINTQSGKKQASLTTTASWVKPEGGVLMQERTTYRFSIVDAVFVIDRLSTLTATGQDVVFKDVKDGFLGLRVARELELPSQQADIFVDAQGNATTVPKISNEGVSGNYLTSEGQQGDAAWGTKGNWTLLTGVKDGKNISIGIIDHPLNTGYPAYRHARGYGLFAINPLGRKVFSDGKEELNFVLKANTSVTFRYRVVIHSGDKITAGEMDELFEEFKKVK